MLTLAPGGETGHHYGTMRAILFACVLAIGCGSATDSAAPAEPGPEGTGGAETLATGGQSSEPIATGGASSETGGDPATGGDASPFTTATGGASATGGKSAIATGGAMATGGSKATGGTPGTGGSSASAICAPPMYNAQCLDLNGGGVTSCTQDCDTCSTTSVDPLIWVEMRCKCVGGIIAPAYCTITATHGPS